MWVTQYHTIDDVLDVLRDGLLSAEAQARFNLPRGSRQWRPETRQAYDRLTRSLMLRRQTAELAKIADSLGLELCYTLRQKAAVSDASE